MRWIFFLCVIFLGCSASSHKNITKTADQNKNFTYTPVLVLEKDLWKAANEFRTSQGKQALKYNPNLAELAKAYSKDMAATHSFSHIGSDSRNLKERLWSAGISFHAAGENLARITTKLEPSQVVETWKKSQIHRENLLDTDFTETGIGIAQDSQGTYYITQLFLLP